MIPTTTIGVNIWKRLLFFNKAKQLSSLGNTHAFIHEYLCFYAQLSNFFAHTNSFLGIFLTFFSVTPLPSFSLSHHFHHSLLVLILSSLSSLSFHSHSHSFSLLIALALCSWSLLLALVVSCTCSCFVKRALPLLSMGLAIAFYYNHSSTYAHMVSIPIYGYNN